MLFLGPPGSPVVDYLREEGAHVTCRSDRVDAAQVQALAPDFIVSYGYRHIVRPDVLSLLRDRCVNLHVSLLPWNRGADPNLWSFVEGTPSGVTIHHMDAGLDTGDVIAQRRVGIPEDATLRTSYDQLQREVQALFRQLWPAIREGRAPRRPQEGPGSAHRVRDRARIEHLLELGWDTPVARLRAATALEPGS